MTLGETCAHGSLKRSCEICERDERIAELEGALEAAKEAYGRHAELEAENARLTTFAAGAVALGSRYRGALEDVRDLKFVAGEHIINHVARLKRIAVDALKEAK